MQCSSLRCWLMQMPRPRTVCAISLLLPAIVLALFISPAAAQQPPANPADLRDVPPPPGVDPWLLTPYEGEAQSRARLTLDEILHQLPLPDYLAEPARPTDESAELPVEAQRAFVAGRMAWHEGRIYGRDGAITHMERALRLAPGDPTILRQLGRIYTAAGNRIRGMHHLKQAVAAGHRDLESLFQIGRFAMDQGQLDEALVVMHRTLALTLERDVPEADAVRPAVHYYLGSMLMNSGHAAAAVNQLDAFFATANERGRLGLMLPEVAFLRRQQALMWQAVGDMHHQLNDPQAALNAYQQARAAANRQPTDPDDDEDEQAAAPATQGLALLPRLVYTHLRLGQPDQAEQQLLAMIEAHDVASVDSDMALYLAAQGLSVDRLIDRLMTAYIDNDRPTPILLAVLGLLPVERQLPLMREHVLARPDDWRTMARLLSENREAMRGRPTDDPLWPELSGMVTQVMKQTADPQDVMTLYAHWRSQMFSQREMFSTDRSGAFAQAHPDVALFQLVHGENLMRAGEHDQAIAVMQRALTLDDALPITRPMLASLLLQRGEHQRVLEVLEPLAAQHHVLPLRERALVELGRIDDALALYDRLEADSPPLPYHFVLREAELLIHLDRHAEAEAALQDALNREPHREALYAALFELYDPADGSTPKVQDAQQQWSRLVRRLMDTLPNSRLGRLKRVELFAARGDFADAERLLVGLLGENDRDIEVLRELLLLYVRVGQPERAIQRMSQTVGHHPQDRAVLMLAFEFYNQVGDRQRQLRVGERLLELGDVPSQLRRVLAIIYMQDNKPDHASRMLAPLVENLAEQDEPVMLISLLGHALMMSGQLDEAERRFEAAAALLPDHAADFLYRRAGIVMLAGEEERSLTLMEQLLEAHPDHPATNNDLAYHWTLQHKNLDRVQAMSQKAVDAEPNSAAYLDTMGWVLYMRGEFDDAVRWLRRARAADEGSHPVILDHLGDALYRTGRSEEAVRVWREAQQRMNTRPDDADPDLEGLGDRLRRKMRAIQAGRPAPVALIPGETDPPVPEPQE